MNAINQAKQIAAYVEPWSLRAGDTIELKASRAQPGAAKLELVRIICGDPGSKGPGRLEELVSVDLPETFELTHQPIEPGSYGSIDLTGLSCDSTLRLKVSIYPTLLEGRQTLLSLRFANGEAVELITEHAQLGLETSAGLVFLSADGLVERHWYAVELRVPLAGGELSSQITPLETRSPGTDLTLGGPASQSLELGAISAGALSALFLANGIHGNSYDGRLAQLEFAFDDVALQWDFSRGIDRRDLVETSGHERHGHVYQLPARAVTGPAWDGSELCWQQNPAHYDAIHFHSDDLYDAGWNTDISLTLPDDLPSGIYAFRITVGDEVDRVPFFVRPAKNAEHKKIALLMSTCTYMAYANHRMLFDGADFVSARNSLTAEHTYVRDHPELGPSCYEKHRDGSGVMFSSRRRPVMQTRPGADRWNFTPDTCLNAFLEHLDLGHDILADEDVHHDGFSALEPYRVIVTATHPEYWSTRMLDALETWQRKGGRLIYLGGNGFYWRVAFSEHWPGTVELRRTEDGVRNWQSEPGEYYHAFNGEYGGLWRRLGRAPNQLVGIGFAAQGFERASFYRRQAAADDPRASWIFNGVDDPMIGTSGLGGGAAGQEIDRTDTLLGTPAHTLTVAVASEFEADMVRTKEDFEAAVTFQQNDPLVRADMVFFETPAGGAVFSVGSISWFGALARDNYNNDVAKITENVVRRFAEAKAFEFPQR